MVNFCEKFPVNFQKKSHTKIVGAACSLIIMQLSWYVSLIPTGVVYYVLMKVLPSSRSFRKGTIFDE